jgi:hypothetical protein
MKGGMKPKLTLDLDLDLDPDLDSDLDSDKMWAGQNAGVGDGDLGRHERASLSPSTSPGTSPGASPGTSPGASPGTSPGASSLELWSPSDTELQLEPASLSPGGSPQELGWSQADVVEMASTPDIIERLDTGVYTENDRLNNENTELKAENDELKNKVTTLVNSNDDLFKYNAVLEAQNAEIRIAHRNNIALIATLPHGTVLDGFEHLVEVDAEEEAGE